MNHITLDRLPLNTPGRVLKLACSPSLARRLEDLGLTEGAQVVPLHRSPAGSPSAYLVRGAVIALRRKDAAGILLEASP